MRLTAVTMIRNEADILPDFLGQCSALFDEVLAVDHSSTDGTSEILAAAATRMPLTVWRFAQKAKAHALVTTALAREAVARGADWIFPLDADEFPALDSRGALLERLAGAGPLLAWTWRNLWPGGAHDFATCRLEGRHETLPSHIRKVAVARRLVADVPRFAFSHGNHAAGPRPAGVVAEDRLGELLHVPVRSGDRLRMKVAINLAGNALRPGLRPNAGLQYRTAEKHMERMAGEDGAPLRRRLALGYPHVGGPMVVSQAQWLEFSPARRLAGLPEPAQDLGTVLARDAVLGWHPLPEAPPDAWRLTLEAGQARLVG